MSRTVGLEQATGEAGRHPLITEAEWYAIRLGSCALAEVAAALTRSCRPELAEESARNAEALDNLRRRAVMTSDRGVPRGEAER